MVTIAEYAVIGAGTVVASNVPPRSLVIGNPGRVTKPIGELTCSTGIAPEGHAYHPYGRIEESR